MTTKHSKEKVGEKAVTSKQSSKNSSQADNIGSQKVAGKGSSSKIRIVLNSYEVGTLQAAVDKLTSAIRTTGSKIESVVRLPTRRSLYVVNKAPHIDKHSREQFERRVHKIVFYVSTNTQTIDALRSLVLPYAVEVRLG